MKRALSDQMAIDYLGEYERPSYECNATECDICENQIPWGHGYFLLPSIGNALAICPACWEENGRDFMCDSFSDLDEAVQRELLGVREILPE